MGPNPSAALDEYYEIYYIISLKLINRVYNKGISYDLRSSRTGCLLLLNNQLHFSAIFSMMIFPNSSFAILGYCCNVPSLYNMAAILVVTLNPAPRRFPVRCNFYKIKTFFLRQTDGFMERHNSQLFVCIADYPYLSGTNLLIDTEFLSYSFHLRKRNSLQVKSGQHILSASEFIHEP